LFGMTFTNPSDGKFDLTTGFLKNKE